MKKISSTGKTQAAAKPTHDEIAALAYGLYVENGCQPGRELEDWLYAEHVLSQANRNGHEQTQAQIPTTKRSIEPARQVQQS